VKSVQKLQTELKEQQITHETKQQNSKFKLNAANSKEKKKTKGLNNSCKVNFELPSHAK
jgi:hypothetical protein